MTLTEKTQKFGVVEASKLHPSKILPQRGADENLVASVRLNAIQHPIIVRESPVGSEEYEIIDGHLRCKALRGQQQVVVDIRGGIDDTDVFRISEATFTRKERTTYERALFYGNWIRAMESKYGPGGAQARVAMAAILSEAEVSYYSTIGRLFERLRKCNASEAIFNALKTQSMNKLCMLAKIGDESKMLAVATKMAESPNMTLRQIEEQTISDSSIPSQIEQLLSDGKTEEEMQEAQVSRLKGATQQLEGSLEEARKTLATLKSNLDNNPRAFVSSEVFDRIEKMLKALKKIEKEANHIINLNTHQNQPSPEPTEPSKSF